MILTFRPTGAGTYTLMKGQYPDSTAHWDKVDEVTSDGDSTYIYEQLVGDIIDTYLYNAPSIQGKINSISVYVRAKQIDTGGQAGPVIYLPGDYLFNLNALTTSYAVYGGAMDRPGGGAWTVADLPNIEFGVCMRSFLPSYEERCTQVWMEIDYMPPHSFGIII